jgi:hypothetical protein
MQLINGVARLESSKSDLKEPPHGMHHLDSRLREAYPGEAPRPPRDVIIHEHNDHE